MIGKPLVFEDVTAVLQRITFDDKHIKLWRKTKMPAKKKTATAKKGKKIGKKSTGYKLEASPNPIGDLLKAFEAKETPKSAKKQRKLKKTYELNRYGEIVLSRELAQRLCSNIDVPQSGEVQLYIRHLDMIRRLLNGSEHQLFVDFLKQEWDQFRAGFEARRAAGEIAFEDVPYFFETNMAVATTDDNGERVGGKVTQVRHGYSWGTPKYQISFSTISAGSGKVGVRGQNVSIYAFNGKRPIAALPIHPITAEEQALLTERGRKFRSFTEKASYLSYTGNLLRKTWWGTNFFRSHGRVMVDASGMRQADPDYMNRFRYESDDEGEPVGMDRIRDEDLWMTEPYLYGFSFSTKKWGELYVRDLNPIDFQSDAFDKLVLDGSKKRSILALVQRSGKGFTDVIANKGGGAIFLLHGNPGLGKTMTAEAVAEVLQRPLYTISVGELGVNPQELEQSLREILEIASKWNAVILLDEADVYLEQRDQHDIVRNAMVGVFLRLLEYHNGVLFLTTNRVTRFDEAFFSRITMALHYPDLSVEARRKVWTNLLTAAAVDTSRLDLDELANLPLNGRQIKNAIRAAQALCNDRPVDMASLHEAANMAIGNINVQQHRTNGHRPEA